MNIKEFTTEVEENIKNVLCIDFDGVIHDHYLGFHDGTLYGKPLKGALNSIKHLAKTYRIIIYTCKANPNRPLINGKTGIELIWEWLEKYEVNQYVEEITYTKPNAIAYIDDKAICFKSWDQTLNQVNSL